MTDETDDQPARSPLTSIYRGTQRIAFIAGAGLMVWLIVGQRLNAPPPHPHPPVLEENALAAPPPPPPPPAETQSNEESHALREQVAKLEGELTAIKEAPAQEANKQQIAHLEEQLSKQDIMLQALEHRIGDMQANSSQQIAALAAFGQLKDNLLRGEPFTASLQSLQKLAASGDAVALLAQLKPLAEKGVATTSALQNQFNHTLPQALAPDKSSYALIRSLYSLIRIRKVGEQPGNDDEAILARAEAKLGRGELSACVDELAALSAPAAQAFAPWVVAAKNRLSALATLDALQLALVQDKPAAAGNPRAPSLPEGEGERP